ncbi:hypothetical protein CK216_25110 [Mesorhizobium sp. WSM3876]|nr:hypothetical protein CK216_25110 [Mesorhizobium sp. WSM3876]
MERPPNIHRPQIEFNLRRRRWFRRWRREQPWRIETSDSNPAIGRPNAARDRAGGLHEGAVTSKLQVA